MYERVFDTVTGGAPTAVLYRFAWGLLVAVGVLAWAFEAMKAALNPRYTPEYGQVLTRVVLAAAALSAYTGITSGIWAFTQHAAVSIYPRTALEGLGELLKAAARRVQDYHFTLLDGAAAIRDAVVVYAALAAFVFALLGHGQTQSLQVIAYNTLFAVGPLLVVLSVFGLPTLRTWLLGTFEIGAWSIVQAIVYRTIETKLRYYLTTLANESLLKLDWLDIFSQLAVLAVLPLAVPVIAARFIGAGLSTAFSSTSPSSLGINSLAAAIGGYVGSRFGREEPQPRSPHHHSKHHHSSRRGDV